MSKSKFFSTRMIVMVSLLSALSIVLTRFLSVQVTETLRLSFGHLPIVLSGLMFGPIAGAVTGFVADFVGCTFFSAYTYFIPLGVTPILMGVIPGLLRILFKKRRDLPSLIATLAPAYILGPLCWSTVSLNLLYGTPFRTMFAARIPFSAMFAVIEIFLTCVFVKTGVMRMIGIPELTFKKKLDTADSAKSTH